MTNFATGILAVAHSPLVMFLAAIGAVVGLAWCAGRLADIYVDRHVNAALYGPNFTATAAEIAALETTEDHR